MRRVEFLLVLLSSFILSCTSNPSSIQNSDSSFVAGINDSTSTFSKESRVGRNYIVLLPDSISTILEKLSFCLKDTTRNFSPTDSAYNYCDVCCFKVFPLQKDWANLFLLEVKYRGTGSGGNHYYVVHKNKEVYEKVNFFMGYLDTVNYNKPYYDIVFKTYDLIYLPEEFREYYTMKLSWNGENYSFKKLLNVYDYYTKKDSTVVLKNFDPEFGNPKHWKYLSRRP